MTDNPYEIFLKVKTDPSKPSFGKILGLDLKTASAEEIKISCDKAIAKVRSQKPGDKNKEWAWLIDQLKKAKAALITRAESRGKTPAKPEAPSPKKAGGKVGTYAPPSLPPKATGATGETAPAKAEQGKETKTSKRNPNRSPGEDDSAKKTSPNKKSETKRTKAPISSNGKTKSVRGSAKASNTADEPSGSPSVALPPTFDKNKKSSAKSSNEKRGGRDRANGDQAAGEPNAFALDAPDENDSFDSDTQFSASSFNSGSITADTIDPMAPVGDPTEEWGTFDIGQIDKYGMISSAAAVANRPKSETRADASPRSAEGAMPVREKTFYGESYRKKSKVGVMIGGTLLAMLIVGGISYGIIFGFNNSGGEEVAKGENDKEKNEKDSTSNNNSAGEDNGNETGENKSNEDNEPDNQPGDGSNNTGQKTPDEDGSNDPGNDDTNPGMKKTDEVMEPEKTGTDTDVPKKTEPTEPKKSPDDMEMKKKEPEAPQPKNSDIAELARLLTEIRVKLNERNFVDSNRLLDKAKGLPITPDHKILLDRLVQVSDLYQKFWNAVVDGCGKLKALDEIKFSETNIVKIVESSEEKIIYRALGQRFEKEPRELQIGLAMKIAEKELDIQSAEGRLIKGAVFAIDAANNPDRAEEAKTIWEEAKLVGAETDELILFLDDTYEGLLASVITREKVPTEEEISEAQERFREKYSDSVKLASRNQKAASEFANQLLKDVPSLDNAADRHANFVAAIFYAGKNGDVELVMTSLSDMNKWFSINLEEETLAALTKVNKNRLKPDQKREITRTAFEYMDRAKAASKGELELKFAELALAAARGTRDPKLVQTATREVQRIKAFMESNNSNQ